VAKPSRRETESLEAQAEDIIIRVRQAAAIGTNRARYRRRPVRTVAWKGNLAGPPDGATRFVGIAVGGGGYSSLLQLIPNLRADFSHVLVAMLQVSDRFIDPLVAYLEGCSAVPVKSVRNVSHIERGHCYVCCAHDATTLAHDASGNFKFERAPASGDDYRDGAIDAMFTSLAHTAGRRAVGVVMSGSGRAGAEGMAVIRRAGGVALVQSLATCMNPSMPRSILLKGAVDKVVADYLLADYIMGLNHARALSEENTQPIGRTATGKG
jgi:two-component system, chemotaxis family, protein-glutamate methylesterase/glutaminase